MSDEYGMRTQYHEEDDKIIVSYSQDIETLLKVNHERRAAEGAFERMGEFKLVMSVDPVAIMDICQKTGLDFFDKEDAKAIFEILKRPEYAKYRTTNRKL